MRVCQCLLRKDNPDMEAIWMEYEITASKATVKQIYDGRFTRPDKLAGVPQLMELLITDEEYNFIVGSNANVVTV